MRKLVKVKILGLILVWGMLLSLAVGAQAEPKTGFYQGQPAKYIFLFIGDGMGLPQITAAKQYIGRSLVMTDMPAQGITTTYAADRFITGSAASATAMASGTKTNIGMIGMDPQQKKLKTTAEMAKEKGMKVGIVSSVSIDHATPAAFYAKVPNRSQYHYIDCQLAESDFDFFGGGGLKDPTGKRKGIESRGNVLEKAEANGYKIVTDKKTFLALKPSDGKILAWNEWLQDSDAMPYTMDQRPDKDISLPEFTAKAIELLDNPNGFFLMVEGGKIDWACHANDAAASIHNTLDFDQAIARAVTFAEKYPAETLIVITGDHECGGLTLGFAGTQYDDHYHFLNKQNVSYEKFSSEILKDFDGDFEMVKPLIEKHFGLKFQGDPKTDRMVLDPFEVAQLAEAFERFKAGDTVKSKSLETAILYGGYNPLTVKCTHILNSKAGLGWTSYSHTGVPVATMAMGVGADTFNGYYDNTDIAKKMMAVMGIAPEVYYVEIESQLKLAAN